jgi:hypothetical protein
MLEKVGVYACFYAKQSFGFRYRYDNHLLF